MSGAKTPAAANQVRDLKTKDEILPALKQSFAYSHAQIMTITPQNAFTGIEGLDGFHTPATQPPLPWPTVTITMGNWWSIYE